MFVYTIQPVVKPVVDNRFDNRLYRVNRGFTVNNTQLVSRYTDLAVSTNVSRNLYHFVSN